MLLKTSHTTTYRYSLPARSSINELRLTPEHSPYQSPHHLSITTSPLAELQTTRDLHGNLIHHFTIEDAHEELTITADSEVETHSYRHQPEKTLSQSIENISTLKQNEELYPFLSDSSCIPSSPETWREAIDLLSNSEKSYGHLAQTLSQPPPHLDRNPS